MATAAAAAATAAAAAGTALGTLPGSYMQSQRVGATVGGPGDDQRPVQAVASPSRTFTPLQSLPSNAIVRVS